MGLLDVLRGKRAAPADGVTRTDTDALRRIADSLDQLAPDVARHVAAFAYLLSRVARADLHVSEDETRAMERLVAAQGALSPEQSILVVQMAKMQARLFGGTEDFLVAREFDDLASREQKMALLRCLFAVSAADDSISTREDNEIAAIARQLRLEPSDVAAVRVEFRDRLAVLQPTPPSSGGAPSA